MRFCARVFSLSLLTVGGLSLGAAAPAQAYPASYFEVVPLQQSSDVCISTATKALKAAGFTIGKWPSTDLTVGGVTPSTRGFVVCIKQPKAGACGKAGSSATLVTAGSDAKKLLAALTKAFKPPAPIECGPA